MTSSRKISLSIASAFFCLLVIFIHVASPIITGADRTTAIYATTLTAWRLSAFVVQAFILVAAVKLGLKSSASETNWGRYYLSRLTRIVLPYIGWVFVYYLWFFSQGYYNFSVTDLIRYIFVGDLSAQFYFVIVIVQFYLLAPVWTALVRRIPAIFALPSATLISLISAKYLPFVLDYFLGIKDFAYSDRIFTTYLVYWVAGLYIGNSFDTFIEKLRKSRAAIIISALLVGSFDAILTYNSFISGVVFSYAEEVHMLYCVCAVMAVLLLCDLVAERWSGMAPVKFMISLDRAGYNIYLTHLLILSVTNVILDRAGITRLTFRVIIAGAATYILSIGINMAYFKVKDIIKNGGSKKRHEKIHG